MARSQLSRFSPSRQATSSPLMCFSIVVFFGSKPSATIEQQMSRSVIMPMSLSDSVSATTGIDPTFWSRMTCATLCAVSVGRQQTGFGVITSRIFMKISPYRIEKSCNGCSGQADNGFRVDVDQGLKPEYYFCRLTQPEGCSARLKSCPDTCLSRGEGPR